MAISKSCQEFLDEVNRKLRDGEIKTYGELYYELGIDRYNLPYNLRDAFLPGVEKPIPECMVYEGHKYIREDLIKIGS